MSVLIKFLFIFQIHSHFYKSEYACIFDINEKSWFPSFKFLLTIAYSPISHNAISVKRVMFRQVMSLTEVETHVKVIRDIRYYHIPLCSFDTFG